MDLIPIVCLRRTDDRFGLTETGAEATSFDDTDMLASQITLESFLFQYNQCRTAAEEGNLLTSLQLTFLDEKTMEKTSIKRIGPYRYQCENFQLEKKEGLDKVRIFTDGERVTGIALGYSSDRSMLRIGSATYDYTDFDFTDGQKVRGFHGETAEWGILNLGVVYEDTVCTELVLRERAGKPIRSYVQAAEFAETMDQTFELESWFPMLYWTALLLLLTIVFCCIGCLISCICRGKSESTADLTDAAQMKEATEK